MQIKIRSAMTIAGTSATDHRTVKPGDVVDVPDDAAKRMIDAGLAEAFNGATTPEKLALPRVRTAPETKPMDGAPEVKDDEQPLTAEKLTPDSEAVPVAVVETVPEDGEQPITASPAAEVREKPSETSDSRKTVNARRRAAQKSDED